MKSLAKRTLASVAIMTTFALVTPALAFAGTTTMTTTVITKATVITTLKQYRAADRIYLAKLKVINRTFQLAVASAKANLASSISDARNSTQRISARATYGFAITQATIARSNALALLGKAPVKPRHRSAFTTTTL